MRYFCFFDTAFCFWRFLTNPPNINTKNNKNRADEFIKEREKYAEIGDDLDFAFVELIPGVGFAYNDRHPKPPTPEQPKLPTPPAIATPPPEAAGVVVGPDGTVLQVVPSADGTGTEMVAVSVAQVAAEVAPEVPKGPPPPPPPFDYFLDLPAEGAEVPFVKNYVPPPPEPEPVAVREDGLPTCNFISSFASHHVGVASDCALVVEVTATTAEAPVSDAPAPATDAPAPTTDAPVTEAAPTETPAVTTEAAPAEAAPPS